MSTNIFVEENESTSPFDWTFTLATGCASPNTETLSLDLHEFFDLYEMMGEIIVEENLTKPSLE